MKRDERTTAPAAEALGGSENATTKRHERRRGHRSRRGGDPVESFVMQLAQSYLEKRDDSEPVDEHAGNPGTEAVAECALRKPGWFCRG